MTTITDTVPSVLSEINLGHYLALLRRRWFLLVIGAVLGGVATYLYVSNQAPSYMARADIAIVRTGFIVNLAPSFRTISDTDPNAQALDQVSNRPSLVTLGSSASMVNEVIARLGDQLPEDLRDPEELKEVVTLSSDGDLYQIDVSAPTPALAALIANAWAEAYVTRINELFAETPLTATSFDSQITQARQDYDTKQSALESFLGDNELERLTRERDLLSLKLNGQVQLEGKLVRLQADAESLRELIRDGQGDATAADELARVLLQASTFNNTGDLPLQLDIPFSGLQTNTTRNQQIAQLDALLKSIQARRAAFDDATEAELYRQLSFVQQQLERAQAQSKELYAERDLSWNVYHLILTKKSETGVSSGNQNQLMRVASLAVPPVEPASDRLLLKTVLGAMAGLLVGAAIAMFIRAS